MNGLGILIYVIVEIALIVATVILVTKGMIVAAIIVGIIAFLGLLPVLGGDAGDIIGGIFD